MSSSYNACQILKTQYKCNILTLYCEQGKKVEINDLDCEMIFRILSKDVSVEFDIMTLLDKKKKVLPVVVQSGAGPAHTGPGSF